MHGEQLVHVLVPGFAVQELPLKISNINGLRFAPDGRLTALGYDGRIHLLSDTNGDGLEDTDNLYWDKSTITVPVGMCWAPEGLYVASHGKISLLKDTKADWKADEEEVIAQGWPPTDVATGGTDAVGLARDNEGNIYFGLLTADYSNPYRVWKDGKSHYETNGIRGTIQKWSPKWKKLETVCTGIRVPFALGFNKAGDLFNTDQEGETWCPNGNPLDEFNHIILGRNYGFPPRQPQYLPDLISDPPIVSFGPQHQSSCGFDFNEPRSASPLWPARKLFGPADWDGDAFVAGESRGKIWRVKLSRTASGYVGQSCTFARLDMLTTDVQISPKGDLYVSCHSGQPDWGTGPNGEGKIFKITYTDPAAPQPTLIWTPTISEVRVSFDRSVDPSITNQLPGTDIEFGYYVSAADRLEKLKPGYQIVKQQEATPRGKIKVLSARLSDDKRVLMLGTAPHPQSVTYALTLKNVKAQDASGTGTTVDLQYSLTGVKVTWRSKARFGADCWLPHLDTTVNDALTRVSAEQDKFFKFASQPGSLELRTRLALPAGTNFLYFTSESKFDAAAGRMHVIGTNSNGHFVAMLRVEAEEDPAEIVVRWETETNKPAFQVAYSRADDPTMRPLPLNFFQLPGAPAVQPPPPLLEEKAELAGGDFERGRAMFFGDKLKCATCHRIRSEGKTIAPDLTNLAHRDPAAIRRDVQDPNALINPDYVAFNVLRTDGEELTGFVRAQKDDSLTIVDVEGKETVVSRSQVRDMHASTVSLMPAGLLEGATEEQVRDLLVFLTSEPPRRTTETVKTLLGKSSGSDKPAITNKRLVWIAGKQDHGPGQHDYPAVQKLWIERLTTSGITATNAWDWPSPNEFEKADVLVFYFWNHDWSEERLKQIDAFLARGAGIVLLHSSVIADKNPEKLTERFGLASQPGHSKYLHTPLDLKLVGSQDNPLLRLLPRQIHFLDEPYWPLIGDISKVTVIGTVEQEGKDNPEVWTFEKGKGRVFGCVLGHYTWTHEDPTYQLLVLRGMAWAAGLDAGAFDSVAVSENAR